MFESWASPAQHGLFKSAVSSRRTENPILQPSVIRNTLIEHSRWFGILDVEVIGISSDSVDSHRAFAEKQDLPFALLSDEGGKVRILYGVPNTLGLFPGRVTYVVDEEGAVRHVFSSQLGVERHVKEAIEALRGHERASKRP